MSDIKSCFVSRFESGRLVEVDFSQLEVIGLAILSGDKVLKSDITSGMDMHRLRAAELFGKREEDVTPAERFLAKRLSFQLQYGAGWKSMAEKNKISGEIAKAFIANYYARYTRVKEWQQEIMEEVKASRRSSEKRTPKGYPAGVGEHISATGRIYRFYEYDAPEWMPEGTLSFSPTEIKNYPIQGFATADIMALFRKLVFRKIFEEGMQDTVKMINTVHDSVMFDVAGETEYNWIEKTCVDIAALLPAEIEARWPIVVDVPLPITVKSGPTWAKMH